MSIKIFVVTTILVLAGSPSIEAQDTAAVMVSGVLVPRSGMAILRGDRLDVVFPYVPLVDVGCDSRDSSSRPVSGFREYSWAVMQEIDPVALTDANYAFMPIAASLPYRYAA